LNIKIISFIIYSTIKYPIKKIGTNIKKNIYQDRNGNKIKIKKLKSNVKTIQLIM